MRIVFIGTVEFSKKALQKLIELDVDIAGVITKEKSHFHADFAELSNICRQYDISYRYVKDINSKENIDWIKNINADVIFCFGWSQIIGKEVLNIAPMGIIGFHPAALPKNRGRHPIIWALVLGLKKTASTFFFMDEGVDSGDILSQEEITITYNDDARTLYDKITDTALRQIQEFVSELENKTFKRIPQDHLKANCWRKRVKKDGEIDFRMSSREIYNLVRGLTKPYPGAHISYNNEQIKVWKVRELDVKLENIEFGKILDVTDNKILIKCGDNAVLLMEHEFLKLPKAGEYLI